jgi:hypothetical protein
MSTYDIALIIMILIVLLQFIKAFLIKIMPDEEDEDEDLSVSWKVKPSNTTDSSLQTTIQEAINEEDEDE